MFPGEFGLFRDIPFGRVDISTLHGVLPDSSEAPLRHWPSPLFLFCVWQQRQCLFPSNLPSRLCASRYCSTDARIATPRIRGSLRHMSDPHCNGDLSPFGQLSYLLDKRGLVCETDSNHNSMRARSTSCVVCWKIDDSQEPSRLSLFCETGCNREDL